MSLKFKPTNTYFYIPQIFASKFLRPPLLCSCASFVNKLFLIFFDNFEVFLIYFIFSGKLALCDFAFMTLGIWGHVLNILVSVKITLALDGFSKLTNFKRISAICELLAGNYSVNF